jgi:hypothetical protein
MRRSHFWRQRFATQPANQIPAFTDSVCLASRPTPKRRGDATALRGARSAFPMTSPTKARSMAGGNGDLAASSCARDTNAC